MTWDPAAIPDDIVEAACYAGHNAYEARSRTQGHVSGLPVPWAEVPEPYRSSTIAGYRAGLAAALTALMDDRGVYLQGPGGRA